MYKELIMDCVIVLIIVSLIIGGRAIGERLDKIEQKLELTHENS